MENYRLKRDWRLVSTLKATFNWMNEEGDIEGNPSELYYYLSENGIGERKCETKASDNKGGYRIKSHPVYLDRIVPWLKGRYDPDIPNYESIKAKEMKDKLAGRIT